MSPLINIQASLSKTDTNYGITNFDNIGSALLTTFHCATLDGWTKVMYMYQNGFNSYMPAIFFISLAILLKYFVFKISIAIMINGFYFHFIRKEIEIEKRLKKLMATKDDSALESNFEINLRIIKTFKIIWYLLKKLSF